MNPLTRDEIPGFQDSGAPLRGLQFAALWQWL